MRKLLIIALVAVCFILANADDPQCTSAATQPVAIPQKTLIITVSGPSYNSRGEILYNFVNDYAALSSEPVSYVLLDTDTEVTSSFLTQFTQVWVYDLSQLSDPYPNTWAAIAQWFQASDFKNIICDGRIISDLVWGGSSHSNPQLFRNYYENLKIRGGGLVLGTDHDVFQHGINELCVALGLNKFFGNYNLVYVPVDSQSLLMTYPQTAYFIQNGVPSLWDDSSPGSAPYNLQPNGLTLYSVAWHSNNVNTPAITTTIKGTVGYLIDITDPVCDQTFPEGTTIDFVAVITSEGTGPYTWKWSTPSLGDFSTSQTTSAVLPPGTHVITVQSVDKLNIVATATVRITVESLSTCNNGIVEGNEECDGGLCCSPDCTFLSAGTTCRESAGECDAEETCSGTSGECPADGFLLGTVCRGSAGVCDVIEYCTGASPACPEDKFAPSSQACEASFGVCDVVANRYCTGNSVSCSGFNIPSLGSEWHEFNVISFNSVSGTTGSVGGRLATKNNLSLGTGFSIGYEVEGTTTSSGLALIVGNDASWTSGQLYPVAQFGLVVGTFTGAEWIESRVSSQGLVAGDLDDDFQAAKDYYVSISDNLAIKADNVVSFVQWSGLFFNCKGSESATRYYVTVDSSVFGQVSWYSTENCNQAASWVINVVGAGDFTFGGGSMPVPSERVLYNVRGSRTVTVGWFGVAGSLLAPTCTVYQSGGVFHGLVIVGDFTKVLSTTQPQCAALQPYGITTQASGEAPEGSDSIPVYSPSALLAGDVLNTGETIVEIKQNSDGSAVLQLSAPLKATVPEGALVSATIDPAAGPRTPSLANSGEVISHFAILILFAVILALVA